MSAILLKPNFLIVGAAKCGTTSVYEYLKTHPDVFMPNHKEPTFFASPEAGGMSDDMQYWGLFKEGIGRKAIGEVSVAYLYDVNSPSLIRAALGPEVKIVVFLRNPVDMAYSLWGHQTRAGGETLSFSEAIDRESARMQDPGFAKRCIGWAANYAYANRAKYVSQVKRYYTVFGEANVKTFIFEEFFVAGLPQYKDLCRFLQISDLHKPIEEVFNVAGVARFPWLMRIANRRMLWKEPFKVIIPESIRKQIVTFVCELNRKEQPLPPMDRETRHRLMALFEADIVELEGLLGKSLRTLWGFQHGADPAGLGR